MYNKNYKKSYFNFGAFYFIFFAFMGIQIPYLNLYLHHIGFTSFQIGIVAAATPLVRVFSPGFWGYIADKGNKNGNLCHILTCISPLVFAALLFAKDFSSILLTIALFTFFWAPILSMVEAASVTFIKQSGADYGRIRVWGTISFITLSYITGMILDYSPIRMVIYGMLLFLVINAGVVNKLPMQKGGDSNLKLGNLITALKERDILVFLTIAMLMQLSHSTYYGFLSIYLESLGYSKTMIGLLWALGPLGEIIIMLKADYLIRRFGTIPLLMFSLFMAALRWTIFASFTHIVPILVAQALHSFTFGTFHVAAVHHAEKIFPFNMKNTAQALYSSSSYGTGLVLGTLISGFLYDKTGAPALFLMSAMAALIGIFLIRLKPNP